MDQLTGSHLLLLFLKRTVILVSIDMVKPNKARKRKRDFIPTVEEVRHLLNGSNSFSKLDLNNGFHQLELYPYSRNVTAFFPHVGLC